MEENMSPGSDREPDVLPLASVEQLRDARDVIRRESVALAELADSLDAAFCDAISLIAGAPGCVVVIGVGKAGLIGQKIVATLASTGTRSWFLHPTEAVHGDLGCIGSDDVVLALSNSGASEEVTRLLPLLNRLDIPVVAITRDTNNPLARASRVVLPIGRHSEAGELGLAPTVSTTAMLAMGDALALVLSKAKGFSATDFATFHPAGSLGRQLTPVREVMRSESELRLAPSTDTVREIMVQLGRPGRRTGAVLLLSETGRLAGIFTDSDLARLFEQRREDQIDAPISDVMTVNPTTISPDALLPEAVRIMSDRKISELPVVDESDVPVGLVDITDILNSGVPSAREPDVPTRRHSA